MSLKVLWTKRAEENFRSLTDYVESNYGQSIKKTLILDTFKIIDILKQFPNIGFLEVEERQIRSFLISKHNRVFYRISDDKLIILSIFDVRQDSDKKEY